MDKIFLTQLVFLNKGAENDFTAFEDKVLPLLGKYNGNLLYRIRPEKDNFVYLSSGELPYEIHILSFDSTAGMENYKNDEERKSVLGLFTRSVKKVILIEGKLTGRNDG
ncbi:MAG: DUF1330 domain-containing protein [Ignavibacteria bacterium]